MWEKMGRIRNLARKNSPTYIIAEAGVNHNGNIEIAKQLIREAKKVGADCVKFQTFKSSDVASENAEKAKYQKISTGSLQKQVDMLKELEFKEAQFIELFEECRKVDIEFASTPYNANDIQFLDQLGVSFFKSSSMHIVELDFLRKIGLTGKPLVISTGMATIEEVDSAVEAIKQTGNTNFTLLQCTTNYPTEIAEVNLLSMIGMANRYNCSYGYSDHTQSEIACLGAIAMGAQVIEKHFTLDKQMSGPDHFASSDPVEFTSLIKNIRAMETVLGSAEKKPTKSELENMVDMRRSISTSKNIKAGEIITEQNIICRRPAIGISPIYWDCVKGKKAQKDLLEGTFLCWENLID